MSVSQPPAGSSAAESPVRRVDTLVVGAGFSGIGLATALTRAGRDDFLVIEAADQVGGTWRANTYPGAACDVPSQLYSFSFALKPDWSMTFSPQPEILDYLKATAEQSGAMEKFWFGTRLLNAHWDSGQQRWIAETTRGVIAARFLITGVGGLSAPKLPAIEGIESFTGALFHTAEWDHSVDLTGKRVAIIGTGASAIQVIPSIQPRVGQLDVYQRTAPWVMPRLERHYTGMEKRFFASVPAAMRAYRSAIYLGRETYVPAFTSMRFLGGPVKTLCRLNIRRGINDPALRAKVTPTFDIGCKRILISSTYYPALAAPNVEVITDGIARITTDGIETRDGRNREVDVLIVATGFHTTDHPIGEIIVGREGKALSEVWAAEGMSAYKGTTVAGFPNLFTMIGANTTLGHSSMVFMIESQIAYVLGAMAAMDDNEYGALEPRVDAQREWNDDLQQRMNGTVWTEGGCASWYLDEHGRNTILWPRSTIAFRALLRRFDASAYRVEPPAPSSPAHHLTESPQ